MRLFLAGFVLLMLAFVVHVITWRIHRPRCPIRVLLCIFSATPLIAVPIYFALGPLPAFNGASLADAVRILLFYVTFSLVYVVLYSAIEVQSPSLAIVFYVSSCGSAGCSEADIANHVTDEESISTRIAAMKAGKMIVVGDGKCTLTPASHRWAALFEFAGNIFSLPLGG